MTIRSDKRLIDQLPAPEVLLDRLGDALREVQLVRRLLKVCDLAEEYREIDRKRIANGGAYVR